MNHSKFSEQGHQEEGQVEEEQAEAINSAQLEALQRDQDQGTDEAEAQGAGQDPHQQSVRLQLRGEQGEAALLQPTVKPRFEGPGRDFWPPCETAPPSLKFNVFKPSVHERAHAQSCPTLL